MEMKSPSSTTAALSSIVILLTPATLHAQGASGLSPQALQIISDFASDLCGDYANEGSSDTVEAEANISAKLDGLFRKLATVEAEVGGGYERDRYTGLIRDQLPEDRRDVRKCRFDVFTTLQGQVLSEASTRAPVISNEFADRYFGRTLWWRENLRYTTQNPALKWIWDETVIGMRVDSYDAVRFESDRVSYFSSKDHPNNDKNSNDWRKSMGTAYAGSAPEECSATGRLTKVEPDGAEFTVTIAVTGNECNEVFNCRTEPSNALVCDLELASGPDRGDLRFIPGPSQ